MRRYTIISPTAKDLKEAKRRAKSLNDPMVVLKLAELMRETIDLLERRKPRNKMIIVVLQPNAQKELDSIIDKWEDIVIDNTRKEVPEKYIAEMIAGQLKRYAVLEAFADMGNEMNCPSDQEYCLLPVELEHVRRAYKFLESLIPTAREVIDEALNPTVRYAPKGTRSLEERILWKFKSPGDIISYRELLRNLNKVDRRELKERLYDMVLDNDLVAIYYKSSEGGKPGVYFATNGPAAEKFVKMKRKDGDEARIMTANELADHWGLNRKTGGRAYIPSSSDTYELRRTHVY